MPNHETKICPACHLPFSCKAGSITICDCSSLLLTSQLKEQLAKDYDDCLCKECLKKLQDKHNGNRIDLELR